MGIVVNTDFSCAAKKFDQIRETLRVSLSNLRGGNRVASSTDSRRDSSDVSLRGVESHIKDKDLEPRSGCTHQCLGNTVATERGLEAEILMALDGTIQ